MLYALLIATTLEIKVFLSNFLFLLIKFSIFIQEEEYKRLSEALAEDGSYNAVGFTYGSDYYDPSEPTEEEEPSKQRGEREAAWTAGVGLPVYTQAACTVVKSAEHISGTRDNTTMTTGENGSKWYSFFW